MPVDKSNNNFAIICQKPYCDVLKGELLWTNVSERLEDENLIEKTEKILLKNFILKLMTMIKSSLSYIGQ